MVGIKRIGFCFTGLTGILLIVHVYGKFSVAISNNDRLAATLKREQHHRLEFPVRDTGQQTRRTSMWEKLRRWLPKPILDENTHHEKNNQYSGKEFGLGSIDKGTDISLGQEIQNNEIIEGDIIDEEKKLFNKWLDSTNHLEDSWAQKILGRKKKDRKK